MLYKCFYCSNQYLYTLDNKMASRFGALLLLFLALSITCDCFSEKAPSDQKVLVLLEDLALKASHSLFFKSLTDRGYALDFKVVGDSSLSLQKFGNYSYDSAIIFAPKANSFGASVDVSALLDFVDSGHDMIVAVDSSPSDINRDLAVECGVDLDEEQGALVVDHLNYVVSDLDTDHTLLAVDNFVKSDLVLGAGGIEAPVLFQGVGATVSPSNDLVFSVLSASATAYSSGGEETSDVPFMQGNSISLVTALQARNNARVVISGSLHLFSDKYFSLPVQTAGGKKYSKSGNQEFATEISKWAFHERGHLKAINVKHHKNGEVEEPSLYRITDRVEYSVEIYEWSGASWKPYKADDVQLQFYMMSPYVLKALTHNGKGLYSISFQVPDVYGVFQFKLDYKRLGYSTINLAQQIPVRPFRHNEYERFIVSAYPYYTSAFSMMASFFVFGFVFLYHK